MKKIIYPAIVAGSLFCSFSVFAGEYYCPVHCVFSGGSEEVKVTITAPNKDAAQKYTQDNRNEICKKLGAKRANWLNLDYFKGCTEK